MASLCLIRSVMQLNTICFIVWESIAATLLLNMPCVNNKSAYHSACSVLSVFSSWEGSHDSLYYPHFLPFEMCFNYFPPTLPHYYLNTFSLPEFCGVYVRLRTNSIQHILNTFVRFLFFPLYFTVSHFQLVY